MAHFIMDYLQKIIQNTRNLFIFKKSSKIIEGKAEIDISILKGKYDIAGWEKNGKAKIGYRIADSYGKIIYDGIINIKGKGPF